MLGGRLRVSRARAAPGSGGSRRSRAGSGGQPGQYTRSPRAAAGRPRAVRRHSVGRGRPPLDGRSKATPRSRSETYASWPMTRWSSSWMSSSRPAASASAVRCRSSGDGVGSPDGWLWTRMTPGRVEPDRVAEQLADPHQRRRDVALVDRRDAQDVVLRVEHARRAAPRARAGPSGGSAGRRRRAGRGSSSGPAGQSASSRRPSSKAATSWAAFASPIPGTAASSSSVARASPVSPSCRRSASAARSTAERPRVPEPHTQPDQLGRGQAAGAPQGEPLARPLRDRHLPDRPTAPGRRRGPAGCSWDPATASPPSGMTRGGQASPRPGRREPADSPRHPDLEDDAEPSGRPSPAAQPGFTAAHRRTQPAGQAAGTPQIGGWRPRRGRAGSR